MWWMLKAELQHNRGVFLGFHLFLFFVFALFSVFRDYPSGEMNSSHLLLMAMLLTGFLYPVVTLSRYQKKEHTDRTLLPPLPVREYLLLRLRVFAIFWLSIVAMYAVYHAVSDFYVWDKTARVSLVGVTGAVLMLNGFYGFIVPDFQGVFQADGKALRRPVRRLLMAVSHLLSFVGFLFFLLVINGPNYTVRKGMGKLYDTFYEWMYLTERGAYSFFILGLLLTVLGYYIASRSRLKT